MSKDGTIKSLVAIGDVKKKIIQMLGYILLQPGGGVTQCLERRLSP